MAKGKLISEDKLELVDVPAIEYKTIMVQNLDLLDFNEQNMPNLTHDFKIGDLIFVTIEQMFDGVKLIAIK